jgi:hypothetical protein
MKIILIIFFDINGTVRFEFISQGQIVNQDIMWKYLKLCVEKGSERCPNDWILHHDNAPTSQGALCQAVFGPKIDY